MASTVYALVINKLREGGESLSSARGPVPDAVEMSPRHEAITNMYFPYFAVANDAKWLRPRLEVRTPERYKNVDLPIAFMLELDDFAAIRSAVKVRLTDHEQLPDRTEDQRTKVCRAKLIIEPVAKSTEPVEPITLIYSLNPTPRGSRLSSASPLYVPINFFEASESPLPFQLSDREKVELMAMGATNDIQAQPQPQAPTFRIKRVALRAFRRHIEITEASSEKASNPASIK
jgi:hypothetical protein